MITTISRRKRWLIAPAVIGLLGFGLAAPGTAAATGAGGDTSEPGATTTSGLLGDAEGGGTWRKLPVRGTPPSDRSAAAVASAAGRVFVVGGVHDDFATGEYTFLSDIHFMSPTNGYWVRHEGQGTRGVPEPRAFAAAAGLGSDVYMFGGSQFDHAGTFFRPYGDLWKLRGSLWTPIRATGGPGPRSGATMWADETGEGRLYVFGGIDATFTTLNDLWSFDLATRTWTLESAPGDPSAPPPRHVAQAGGVVSDGMLTLYGGEGLGETGFFELPDTWQYDLADGTWHNTTPDPVNPDPARNYGAAGLIGDSMYLFGGDLPGGTGGCGAPFPQNPTDEMWSFDTAGGTWRQVATSGDNPGPLKRHGATVVGDSMYVVTGWDFQCAADGTGPGQVWNTDTYAFTPGG